MSDYDDSRDSTPQYYSPDDIDEKVIGMDELSKSTKEAMGMELKREKVSGASELAQLHHVYPDLVGLCKPP